MSPLVLAICCAFNGALAASELVHQWLQGDPGLEHYAGFPPMESEGKIFFTSVSQLPFIHLPMSWDPATGVVEALSTEWDYYQGTPRNAGRLAGWSTPFTWGGELWTLEIQDSIRLVRRTAQSWERVRTLGMGASYGGVFNAIAIPFRYVWRFADRFVFLSPKTTNGDFELWQSDGTTQGTVRLIANIYSGNSDVLETEHGLFVVDRNGQLWDCRSAPCS